MAKQREKKQKTNPEAKPDAVKKSKEAAAEESSSKAGGAEKETSRNGKPAGDAKEKTAQGGKKAPSLGWMFYLAVGAVLGALILYYVMQKTVWNPNRTAEKAARVAFDAAYSVSYEDFVKSTIYSDDCQKYLRMEVFDELHQIETEFKNMESEKDAFTMQIDNITVKEYAKGSDYYNSAVGMLCDEHAETVPDKIEKVATAEISYRLKYRGESTHEKGTELYVVFRVKGNWYAHPLLGLTQ